MAKEIIKKIKEKYEIIIDMTTNDREVLNAQIALNVIKEIEDALKRQNRFDEFPLLEVKTIAEAIYEDL